MELGCVLTSCNLNEKYTKFIPLFINKWKKFFPNVDVKIILISDKLPPKFESCRDHLILFPPLDNMNTAYISQVIRLVYPALLKQYKDKGILITDMDMIPMNQYYYESIKQVSSDITVDHLINYRTVDATSSHDDIVLCYNIAKSQVWSDIFTIFELQDVINFLNRYYQTTFLGVHGGIGWFSDQKLLKVYGSRKIYFIGDTVTKYNRFDCVKGWLTSGKAIFRSIEEVKANINNEMYSDMHFYGCECPYTEEQLNELVEN